MVIEIPAAVIEELRKIDWSSVKDSVADYAPAIAVVRSTWDRETLAAMAEGKLFVTDEQLNEYIAQRLASDPGGNIKELRLRSRADGRIDIEADTTTKVGKVELSGTLEKLVHNKKETQLVYRVRERNLPNHGLMSWIVSRVSLSVVERMVGRLEFSDDLPVKIKRNKVIVDYKQALEASNFGQTTFRGYPLIDIIEIENAVVKEGGIEFDTKFNVPPELKESLRAIVSDLRSAAKPADENK